ncbi:tetratricopeptide repeat protein [Hymenobacter jeollabukensis]|uniref:Tol-pal system protein YbgF n=1 Tax=Hymenobacter jeollabukensis TaxID=2025313 RepID=A0A5R8WWK0_9BACT|nr:tol-pal system protein YbgF [Hymenobacter jeollabukensis]TLM96612.1 tol-pal system protein YbgF [Hymenobacter jeollabukensis]
MGKLYFCFFLLTPRLRRSAAGLLAALGLLLAAPVAQGQSAADTLRVVRLANVDVNPEAVQGWLLVNPDIRLELEGAVDNLYNFKHDKAQRQFRSLRRRYPQHPMPYFLMGLAQWWQMVPSQLQTTSYDRPFLAYMDTAITKAEALYAQDAHNYEACFFLSAAYGFDARLNALRHNWRRATVSSKHALDYLAKSQEANNLSPEFLFGQGLLNYYAPWISDNYPLLKPVLLFFPKGNRQLGLQQLRHVAANGFYTAPETQYFLLQILQYEEHRPHEALPLARTLAARYPDNPYFQRTYAQLCFSQGQIRECERVSLEILDKLGHGQAGYEAVSGRYASYFLAYLQQYRYKNPAQARELYQRCLVFAETTGDTRGGYYLNAHWNLAKLAQQQQDWSAATRYFALVKAQAEPYSEMATDAEAYFKEKRHARAGKHGGDGTSTLSLAR